jgi:lipid II:glycine glycyltransferase (peptidoglycan interpeptide bridge formation enzyme)
MYLSAELHQAGLRISKPILQHNWSTLVLQIDALPEHPESHYSENHRRSIRKARTAGYYVKELTSRDEIKDFSIIYREMYNRRKITMPFADPWQVFSGIADFFSNYNTGLMLGVFNGDAVLRGAMVIGYHGNKMFYHYGASALAIDRIPILHAAFHEAILLARQRNFRVFDLGGYANANAEDGQLSQVNRFKEGFRGNLIHYEDVIEVPLNAAKYKVMRTAISLRRKLKN